MKKDLQQLDILKKVQSGIISIEEASDRLAILDERGFADSSEIQSFFEPGSQDSEGYDSTVDDISDFRQKRMRRWQIFWVIPFVIGMFLMVQSCVWMVNAWQAAGLSWGFWLSWIPFLTGMIILILAWLSRKSIWLHIRIKQKRKESRNSKKALHLALSFPFPVRAIAWILRTFNIFIPDEIPSKALADFLLELEESETLVDNPLHVWVDDKDDGDQVEVFIG